MFKVFSYKIEILLNCHNWINKCLKCFRIVNVFFRELLYSKNMLVTYSELLIQIASGTATFTF